MRLEMDFKYFFFEPLKYEDFQAYSKQGTPSKTLLCGYLGWVIEYCRKAEYFYQYQYRKHSALTQVAFNNLFNIPDYEHPDNFGLEIAWKDWKEQYQLDDHYERYQQAIADLTNLKKIAEDKIKSLSLEYQNETILRRDVNQTWFDKIIDNTPRVADELRSLPYEKYRQTTHWEKVRSAILLINSAMCQAEECRITGESWYGGSESEIHVHHINYSNLGNERFEDLALLCKRHHELIHDNLKNNGTSGIEIVDIFY